VLTIEREANMPNKATFTSVEIVQLVRGTNAGRVDVKCPLTQSVIKAMGWVQKRMQKEGDHEEEVVVSTELPSFARGAISLDGELAASIAHFTPNDEDLATNAIEFTITKCNDFKAYRLQAEGSGAKDQFRRELRFQIHFNSQKGACTIEKYMLSVPKSKLQVTYEKRAVQDELPGTGAESTQEEFAEV
jgi:hypothetical protein